MYVKIVRKLQIALSTVIIETLIFVARYKQVLRTYPATRPRNAFCK